MNLNDFEVECRYKVFVDHHGLFIYNSGELVAEGTVPVAKLDIEETKWHLKDEYCFKLNLDEDQVYIWIDDEPVEEQMEIYEAWLKASKMKISS